MTAYYNEIDPQAAATLRELIRQGHIAPGDVDERSIEDVRPDELFGYTQCHFFAGIGAPHIRERLYWVADAMCGGQQGQRVMGRSGDTATQAHREVNRVVYAGGRGGMADDKLQQRQDGEARCHEKGGRQQKPAEASGHCSNMRPGPTNGYWADADWLGCRDDRWRPVEPGTFPLAHGAAERVGRLRGYGNAIVAPAAQAFIESYIKVKWGTHALHMETTHD